MSVHSIVEGVLLGGVVLSCWLGGIGMLRMRDPTQALHYLSVPATAGSSLLTIAVFLHTGNTQAGWKTLLITFVLLGMNSVVTHASARAFRMREIGHWEPRPEDKVEMVGAENRQ